MANNKGPKPVFVKRDILDVVERLDPENRLAPEPAYNFTNGRKFTKRDEYSGY